MNIRVRLLSSARTALFASILVLAASVSARAQLLDSAGLDHLKCYRVDDSLQSTKYLADLENQFGIEPGCVIMLPARLLCVETNKRVISSPAPPGGGPSGDPAGHFLCYAVRCPTTAAPDSIGVEDQFGRRRIKLDRERILCAPANKLICGDGDLDPGEACDPGSAATNVCPGGGPCNAACTCPPGVCCQCPTSCTMASGTICPDGCLPMVGTCSSAGFCETCPCGDTCTDDAGNVGICQEGDDEGPCECLPPPGCPCGDPCTVGGLAGVCEQIAGSNICECRPPQPCVCGDVCVSPDATPGHCQPTNDGNVCECRPDTSDCPCDATCTTAAGPGHCRPTSDPTVCECRPDTPECQCGVPCTDPNGQVGICRQLPGTPAGVCTCAPPPPPECPCGKPCVGTNGLPGRCRPINGSAGECGCVTG